MNNRNKPIWGMTHSFGVYVLWGRENAQSYEQVLGEFATLMQAQDFADAHHQTHKWASYRVGKL